MVGKLLTIMLFSIVTAVLNLLSMGLTGWMVVAQLPGFGLPPPMAIAVVLIALVPISALFSALCLALAAFARSTKEGQYYLMPLLLVTMPLVILPMSPGVELNLGNSLIPVTGVVLLLRSVLEGNYWQAVQFSPAVVAVTLLACLLAIRWAVDQFNSRVGAVPRERAAGPRALAAASAARPAADADRGRGRLLRRADPGGQLLPEFFADDARRFWRFRPDGPRHATGGDCRPGAVDDVLSDQQPAANAAVEVAALADHSRGGPVGRRAAPGGQPPAVGRATASIRSARTSGRRWRRCRSCSARPTSGRWCW